MLDKIKQFFTDHFHPQEVTTEAADQYHLAAAALMIEVATIDNACDTIEIKTLRKILVEQFHLSNTQVDELVTLAKAESHEATSLYQFTQLVNIDCTPLEKYRLIRGMWQIAYADTEIDKYEEHLIRKVANLIYLSHSDFIRAKHEARVKHEERDK